MIAFLAAGALTSAHAPRTILFVGNSFTFGAMSDAMTYRKDSVEDLNGDGMGGVPALFKRFADEAGLRYSVFLETAAGQTLTWHLANKRTVIDRPWDAVVLQRYSTLSPEKPGDPTETIAAARGLAKLFRQRNPRADISLVATWTRADLTYPSGKALVGSTGPKDGSRPQTCGRPGASDGSFDPPHCSGRRGIQLCDCPKDCGP